MIAPLSTKPDESSVSTRLKTARRVIAGILLPADRERAPTIAAWKGWLLIAWMAMAVAVYALSMLGMFDR